MTVKRFFTLSIFLLASILFLADFATAKPDCAALDTTGNAKGANIPGRLATYEVVGKGRAQFYSGPNESCIMPGVFIIPKDQVTAYVEYKGFTSVLYINPKTGGEAQGWVRTSRLRGTGTGISPR